MLELSASAADVAMTNLSAEAMKESLGQLKPPQLKRLLLKDVLDYTYREIAEAEGVSIRAVQYSVAAAHKNLREILANRLRKTPPGKPSK